jgi:AhpD family alkylhydroperoxidase
MTQRLDYASIASDGMKALGGVHGYVRKSGLPADLVNLVFLRVSQINGCAYCIDTHARDLLASGMPNRKVLLVSAWREAGLFDAREQAALRWAETLTLLPQTGAPDEDHAAAAAVFSPKELTDLTIAIGLINVYNRIAVGFRRGPDSV